jgi:excisionase family DNA binding protein
MLVAEEDAMTTAQAGVVFPPRDLTALLDLGRFLEHHTEPGLLLGPDGEQVPLPEEVYQVLVEVVEAMREGKVITLVPHTQRLTTQEAADFLGISRPTLVKLLEAGKIPYEQPGRHRRIMFTDLLAYQERQRENRRAALDQMTEDASEAGLYGGTPEDYAAALKRARRRVARQGDASLRCRVIRQYSTRVSLCPSCSRTRYCAWPRRACTVRCGQT